MPGKRLSPAKPTKKAGTARRSITSSTTAGNGQPVPTPDPPPLTPEQEQLFLELMGRGASPAGICQQLGLSALSYLRTHFDSEPFRECEARTQLLLSQNIAAALYRAAMEGNFNAQTFWLKTLPPPGWQPSGTPTDSLDQLTDEELLELAAAQGLDFPAAAAAATGGTGSA